MIHLPAIIEDLSLILIAAAIVILVFKKLKQPVVLGYLVAGLLVGNHVPYFPSVKDSESIRVWGEIGVIFLLFSLGLEFSFKKLASIGRPASITAIFEVLFMLGVGYLLGQMLDWSKMDSLFLGGILSVSSTTIIVRAFEELGFKGRRFVSLVFGVLIVEDLIAILLLVLLSTIAVTQSLSGVSLLLTSARLGFFLVLWFAVGIYVLPIVLSQIRRLLNDETTLIVAIGLCLLMVSLTTSVGFSPALGAFVMGSILAETREGKRIEHLLVPVKNLFAAIFFVSVGMLIDPQVLVDDFGVIALITLVTVIGKFMSSSLGALISGKDLKQSVQTGMSLAQIGEFSFIIATLGVSLKVTSDFLYPVAVAVSAVTTFTTPYQIKYSDAFFHWFEKQIPIGVKDRLAKYESVLSSKSEGPFLMLLWNQYGMKLVLNAVLIVALALGGSRFGVSWLSERFPNAEWTQFVACMLTLMVSAPFLWAIVIGAPARSSRISRESQIRLEKLQFGVSIIRTLGGFVLVAFVVGRFYPVQNFASLILIGLAVSGIYFSRFAEPLYKAVEKRFLRNLNESHSQEEGRTSPFSELAPWDAVLSEFTLSPNSLLVGQSLMQAKLKEHYGVMVTMVERGHQKILAPGREEKLYPNDKLYLIGTDDQLTRVGKVLEGAPVAAEKDQFESFGLEAVILPENSPFLNCPIRTCGIRESVNGIIVGIEREGRRILNPDSNLSLLPGDLIWLVGNKSQIRKLK